MAGVRYGTRPYGTALYGGDTVHEFATRFFRALENGYGRVFVQWSAPGGAWNRLRLVRSLAGEPLNEDDGTTLLEVAVDSLVLQYQDEGLAAHRHYTYALFVRELAQGHWVRAGVAEAVVTADYGHTARLYNRVPDVFKGDLTSSPSSPTDDEETLLYRYLSLFGHGLDYLRSVAHGVTLAHDPMLSSARLLPPLAASLGVAYEPEFGDRTVRRMVGSAMRLASIKGTLTGVRQLTQVFTGWQVAARIGDNLALDRLDAGPDGGVGRWTGRFNASTSYRAFTDAERGPAGQGAVVITAQQPSGVQMTVDCNPAGDLAPTERRLYAIPIVPKLNFTVSQYVASTVGGLTARMGITWLDSDGHPLGPATWGDPATVTDGWLTRPYVTTRAPADARYLEHALRIDGVLAQGAEVRACGLMVQESDAIASWQPSREVLVYLGGSLVNYVGNTSGQGLSAEGWLHATSLVDGASFLAFSPSIFRRPKLTDVYDLVDALLVETDGDVQPDGNSYLDNRARTTPDNYTGRRFRFPTYGDATLALDAAAAMLAGQPDRVALAQVRSALFRAEFYESIYMASIRQVEERQTWTVLADVRHFGPETGQVQVGFALFDGPNFSRFEWGPVVETSQVFETVGFAFEMEEDADYDRVAFAIRSNDEYLAWCNAALESVPLEAARQFDGSTSSATNDYLWEGVPFRSPSHYFPGLALRLSRLRALLEEFVPHPASFRFQFGVDPVPESPRSSIGTDLDPDDVQTTEVGRRMRLRWNVRGFAGSEVGLRWSLRSRVVHQDATLLWNVRGMGRELTLLWPTTEPVGRDLLVMWKGYLAGNDVTLQWQAREQLVLSDALIVSMRKPYRGIRDYTDGTYAGRQQRFPAYRDTDFEP